MDRFPSDHNDDRPCKFNICCCQRTNFFVYVDPQILFPVRHPKIFNFVQFVLFLQQHSDKKLIAVQETIAKIFESFFLG